ncbi:hypothetical protein QUC31_016657 [Theobroma cacao]
MTHRNWLKGLIGEGLLNSTAPEVILRVPLLPSMLRIYTEILSSSNVIEIQIFDFVVDECILLVIEELV